MGGKFVEEDVAGLQGEQALFPAGADRAFLGEQRTGAELEGDRAEFGVVDPVLPFLQAPDAAGHDDGGFAQAKFAHDFAQCQDAGKGGFGFLRVFAVGEAVMAAGEPGVLVDHAAHEVGHF